MRWPLGARGRASGATPKTPGADILRATPGGEMMVKSSGGFPPDSTSGAVGPRGNLWGIVLAGGDGRRLEGFVGRILEKGGPKQYCAFIGQRSMLQHTLDRARHLVPRERLLTVITAAHRAWALRQLDGQPGETILIQPANRDTAPGALLP